MKKVINLIIIMLVMFASSMSLVAFSPEETISFFVNPQLGKNTSSDAYSQLELSSLDIELLFSDKNEHINVTAIGAYQIPLSVSNPNVGNLINSSWPMYCHDTRHTGQSTHSTSDNPGDTIWRLKCNDYIQGSAVIDEEGNIYFGTYNGDLYSLTPNGSIRWKYHLGDYFIDTSPVISINNTLYIGTSFGAGGYNRLFAFQLNGSMKWKYPCSEIYSSPAIGPDGTIYFGASNEYIHALYPNGTLKWRYKTNNVVYSSPAIGDDGTIYCGSHDSKLYALNPNGTLKWLFDTGNWIRVSPCIGDDGTIYCVSLDNYLYAINPNGTMKWKTNVGAGTSPTIGLDGTIYCGYDKLKALNPDGTLKWQLELGEDRTIRGGTPCHSAEGIIYFGTTIYPYWGGEIVAVNPDGTERWRKMIANDWVEFAPIIAEDGSVYIGSSSVENGDSYGNLYAFNRADLESQPGPPLYGIINQPISFNGNGRGGYPPYTYEWDLGDGNVTNGQNITHTYSKSGNYTVTLKIIDSHGNFSTNATYAWVQSTNNPPETPNVDGPTEGNIDTTYTYNICSHDEYGLPVWYYIDWGDDSNTGWFGPNPSDTIVSKTHRWSEKGTYTVKVKAKDPYDAESDWGTLVVTMPVSVEVYEFPLLRLLLEILGRFPNAFPILQYLGF